MVGQWYLDTAVISGLLLTKCHLIPPHETDQMKMMMKMMMMMMMMSVSESGVQCLTGRTVLGMLGQVGPVSQSCQHRPVLVSSRAPLPHHHLPPLSSPLASSQQRQHEPLITRH